MLLQITQNERLTLFDATIIAVKNNDSIQTRDEYIVEAENVMGEIRLYMGDLDACNTFVSVLLIDIRRGAVPTISC